ncbi:MAG: ChbG/HpnK family deacetylase [Heliobacteriaceae bacterium]|nr:ChbG/HpnK family deacetylase [Heliobacteriaceae bacterium]MDD4588166.1 ChbG/HpnK family deacetylase [Heliobacteriaceae bacterium]
MVGGRLVINADDFGLSRGVNAGIEQAYRAGMVKAASLLVNLPGFADAVRVFRRNPGLAVGIHLNISVGPPVTSQPAGCLVDATGLFVKPVGKLATLNFVAVEEEWRAQIRRLLAAGVKPTHLDSHHHVHLYPALFSRCLQLATEFAIPVVRVVNPRYVPWADLDQALNPGEWLSPDACRETWALANRRAKAKIGFCQGVFGFPRWQDALAGRLASALGQMAAPGWFEFFCHPGLPDPELTALSSFTTGRGEELTALLGPGVSHLLTKARIPLGSFRQIL